MIELTVELRMRIRLTLMSGFAADGWVIAPLKRPVKARLRTLTRSGL
jgi:hypothetical protein